MGREAELKAIAGCVAAAAEGHAGVLWIEGDPGFGKTALVRHVVATLPSEFVVLSAEADELSREQPFGRLTQLAPVTTTSPLAAGLDLLRAVGDQPEGKPVTIVAEDLHWADSPSRTALATMARKNSDTGAGRARW